MIQKVNVVGASTAPSDGAVIVPGKTIKKFIELSSNEQGKLIVQWLNNLSVENLQLKKVTNVS